jgi:hypothetical protein
VLRRPVVLTRLHVHKARHGTRGVHAGAGRRPVGRARPRERPR